nr:putative cytosolic signal transduction protein [uncultured bacterium]
MASTHVQKQCELWIVNHWLPEKYGCAFSEDKMKMQGRGNFAFDAVSENKEIIGNVSTASAFTHRGSVASGKKSKLRADCLMLALVLAKTKLMLLTESDMAEFALKEQKEGRLPLDVKIYHVELPQELKIQLSKARDVASKEVRGRA